jgi:hypothetical protein
MANRLKSAAAARKKIKAKTKENMEARRKWQNKNNPFEKEAKPETRTRLAAPGRSGIEAPRAKASVSSRIEAVKAKMKKRSIDASFLGGQKGKKLVLAEDMKKKYPVQGKKR